jgi:hypothetical protein
VGHLNTDSKFLERDPVTGVVPMTWAQAQLATTTDFAPESWFWTHFSGGLNNQVIYMLQLPTW